MKDPKEFKINPFFAVGACVMACSVVTIVDYAVRKKHSKASHIGELVAGVAGLMLGTAIINTPTEIAKKQLAKTDLMDDEGVIETEQQIREDMNLSVDRGNQPIAPQRTVEVDDEASIEDFI